MKENMVIFDLFDILEHMLNVRQSQIKAITDTIKEKCIHFSTPEEPIISPNGSSQNWIIDLRPLLLETKALDIITDLFWDEHEQYLPFQVGGMEVAAVPLVTAILMKGHQRGHKVNGFVIRKERKKYGRGKIIEGILTDEPIILVDDLINSGKSLEKSRLAIEQEGKTVSRVFTILSYESKAADHWLKQHHIDLIYLANRDPFDLTWSGDKEWKPPLVYYQVEWRFFEPGAYPFLNIPKSTPLLVENKLYMGTQSGKMFCIDRYKGTVLWAFDTKTHHNKGILSSPAHHKGRIYFGAYNGIMYCLDAKTGKLIWHNPCCEFIGSSPLIVPENNMVYVGLEHQRPRQMGSNAAFDMDSGNRVWERALRKYQHGSAAYYKPKNMVIFGNADHDVTAYDAKTGKTIWKHDTIRSHKYPPAVDEAKKLVVSTSFDGNIYILDVETGERKAAIQTNDICYTTPLITEDKIYAGSGDRYMYIIDAHTFELIKKMDFRARVYSSPRMINGKVVFGTGGGKIIELNPETLQVDSNAQLSDSITNAISASIDGEYLFASTIMNELYCIKRTDLS